MFGRLKYCPIAVSVDFFVLPTCKKFAALLPVHAPVVTVGGVVEAVSAPRGTGALSATMLPMSNV